MPGNQSTRCLVKACRIAERLPADACPIERDSPLKDTELHLRNLNCPHYDKCITMAAYLAWECLICTACPYYNTTTVVDNRYLSGKASISNYFPPSRTREQGDN